MILAVLIAGLAPSACSSKDRVTFQAKVADLRKPSNSFGKNKAPDDLVRITLPGKLLHPPVAVNLVRRGEADWSTPERAIASIFWANVAGDVAWIVENYAPAEREEVRKQFADPAAAQRVRDYYRNAGKAVITASAEIGGFTALFLLGLDDDGDPTLLSAVLSKGPSGWRQTNALARDDTFDLVSAALRTAGAR